MANNRWQIVIFALIITAAFFAGGWFFSRISQRDITREVEGLYQKDGESLGIYNSVSAEDMVASEQMAEDALPPGKQMLPLDTDAPATHLKLTNKEDIAGLAPKKIEKIEPTPVTDNPVSSFRMPSIQLNGDEVSKGGMYEEDGEEIPNHITLIAAPVRLVVINNLDEYKVFKQRARGGYPTLDFAKQKLIVLESDSNLPDNVFEIVSADKQDGSLIVSYRVNVFGLDKKINSHTFIVVDKAPLPVELKQVI